MAEKEVVSLKKELESKNNEITELKAQITQKDNEITELKAQLEKLTAEKSQEAEAQVEETPRYDKHKFLEYIKDGNVEAIQFLIDRKEINLEKKDKNDLTPLMVAVALGKLETVKVLVENGADIQARNRNGSSVMMQASNKGHHEIVLYLRTQGAR